MKFRNFIVTFLLLNCTQHAVERRLISYKMMPNVVLATWIPSNFYLKFFEKLFLFYLSLALCYLHKSCPTLLQELYCTALSFACPINENDYRLSCTLLGFEYNG